MLLWHSVLWLNWRITKLLNQIVQENYKLWRGNFEIFEGFLRTRSRTLVNLTINSLLPLHQVLIPFPFIIESLKLKRTTREKTTPKVVHSCRVKLSCCWPTFMTRTVFFFCTNRICRQTRWRFFNVVREKVRVNGRSYKLDVG